MKLLFLISLVQMPPKQPKEQNDIEEAKDSVVFYFFGGLLTLVVYWEDVVQLNIKGFGVIGTCLNALWFAYRKGQRIHRKQKRK